ncbi:hypothetical protein CQW23_26495 [Capsicum baccatum]|uniref:Uncharacterized protein n=1 Tax=Capsicum baccatum TaxID=33114 RepID=A0A2G2VNY6_CAPBA|nr:hypothetical protein CQW23_26495 [Capsicum baccatum]
MKATAVAGQESSLVTNYVLKLGELCEMISTGRVSVPVQEKSYYALAAFCENMGEEILPFLNPLMGKLLGALQSSPLAISVGRSRIEPILPPFIEAGISVRNFTSFSLACQEIICLIEILDYNYGLKILNLPQLICSISFLAILFLPLVMGIVLNYMMFLCTIVNSALTTTIVRVLKGVGSTTLGFVMLGGVEVHALNVTGLVINTTGDVCFCHNILLTVVVLFDGVCGVVGGVGIGGFGGDIDGLCVGIGGGGGGGIGGGISGLGGIGGGLGGPSIATGGTFFRRY